MTVGALDLGAGTAPDTTSLLDYYLIRAAVGDPGPADRPGGWWPANTAWSR